MLRWATLKGVISIIFFIAISALIEYFIVLYAVSLGVKDESLLQWSFQFPGTSWNITIAVSILFHLVPLCAVAALTFSWICLTKYVALSVQKTLEERFRQVEKGKRKASVFGVVKSMLLRFRCAAYFSGKLSLAKAAVKSAFILLFVFSAFILLFSLLAYPRLIHHAFLGLYRGNPSTLEFALSVNNAVKGLAETLAPVGWVCTAINNAIIAEAPRFRILAASFEGLTKPLADLPPVGKYLFLQNFSAWFSAFLVLFYGLCVQSYQRRRVKRFRGL